LTALTVIVLPRISFGRELQPENTNYISLFLYIYIGAVIFIEDRNAVRIPKCSSKGMFATLPGQRPAVKTNNE
jgi:hypothetical protein